MKLTIKKDPAPIVRWGDIKIGEVFSWGTRECWYLKISADQYAPLGDTGKPVDSFHIATVSTLRVASEVVVVCV